MTDSKNYPYLQAVSIIKIQSILTIIFGGIGVLFGLLVLGLFGFAMSAAYSDADALGFFILFICTLLFWLLPHIYFIISGVTLYRLPHPRIVKILTIVNLVIGVFWNIVLLVFAIITLVQSADYESGYKPTPRSAK